MGWKPDFRRLSPYAQAFGWGFLGVAAFAPFSLWPLGIICWAALYLLLRAAHNKRQAAAIGFSFGLGQFLTGVSWVYVSMHDIGGMPMLLALVATFLFAAYLALFPLLAGAGFTLCLASRNNRHAPSATRLDSGLFRPLLFATCWLLTEWMRGTLFTGFPWLNLGYSQAPPSPLAGYAPILGGYGLSFTTAWLAGLSGEFWLRLRNAGWHFSSALNPQSLMIATLVLSGVGLQQIHWTKPEGSPLKVSLLQGNVSQSMKWQPEQYVQTLLTYFQLARTNPATLIVLPETAIPSLLSEAPAEFLQDLQRIGQEQRGNILMGVPTGESGKDRSWYANSAVSMGIDPLQVYNKVHLVPFGEITPPGFGWFLKLINMPLPNFTAGESNQPLMQLSHQQIAVNICYEDIFGAAIAQRADEATIMVNMSNTAWFGDSLAQPQHLQIAQIRALENGRPMLRATNTGMTAVIGPQGERQAVLAAFTRNALVASVQGMRGTTPYQRWLDWPIIGFSLAILAWGLLTRHRHTV
ncbi:MAG: apolipoprotein N-acyltransferase [Fluviibacter sp.]